jgi:hypothetical protein
MACGIRKWFILVTFNMKKRAIFGRDTWRRKERELTSSRRLGRKRRDGVVDGVRSSRTRDVAVASGRSGTWLLAVAPRLVGRMEGGAAAGQRVPHKASEGHVEAEVGEPGSHAGEELQSS